MAKPSGHIIYRGASMLDGKPIVVIAITKSRNVKTADMIQTYILRADIDPRKANRTGEDYSICGACPLKGVPTATQSGLATGRGCYVRIDQGPLNVWRTARRGRYPVATGHKAIAAIGAGRMVRIGTYGDGAAVPGWVWDSLCSDAQGHTAYSHQSRTSGADYDKIRYMIAAQSEIDARAAWDDGARTFRIIASVIELVKGREILCPASKEAGHRTTCDRCGLCGGASVAAKSIAIVAHGGGARSAAAALA